MNKMDSAYHIVKMSNTTDMLNTVEKLINQGWEPIGGISIDGNGNLYQSLIDRQLMLNRINIANNKDLDFPKLNLR